MPDIQLNQLAEINPLRPKIDLNLTDEVSFIPMSDVSESGRWVNHQSRQFGDVSRGYTYFEEGDVLFAKITPCMENGKGCYPRNLVNGIGFASTEFHVMRAKDNADPDFMYQWSIYKPLRLKASATMIGSAGQQRVPASFLKSLKVPAIAKQEQTKIAKILSTVDRAIEQTEALIAKQQRIKTSLMQDLLTRGIDEHGNLRSEQTHQFKDSPLGRIPVEWESGYFESCISGSPKNGIYKPQSAYGERGTPIIRIDAFGHGDRIKAQSYKRVVLSKSEIEQYRLREGEILINRVNSIQYLGKTALVEQLSEATVFESNMMRLTMDQRRMLPDFALLLLTGLAASRHFLRNAKLAIAQASINQHDVISLPIQRPQLEEQCAICARIASNRDSIKNTFSGLEKLHRVKTALMQDLLTGKRRVTEL